MAHPQVLSRARTLAVSGLVTALAGAVVLPAPAAATTQITDLGVLQGGSYSFAFAINSSGTVVGESAVGISNHAARWNPDGTINDLGMLPTGVDSTANAINDVGVIAGRGSMRDALHNFHTHAVRWNLDGTIDNLGTLSGQSSSQANTINDTGTIVGYSYGCCPGTRAVQWAPDGTITTLGIATNSSTSIATAINNNGMVASYETTDTSRVARWDDTGEITLLNPLPGDATSWASPRSRTRMRWSTGMPAAGGPTGISRPR